VAHRKSAKKTIKQNVGRRALNRWRRDRIKSSIDAFDEAMEAGDKSVADEKLRDVFKQLDQVAAKGIIHKKTADRRKGRMAKRLAALA
jgi:small subunit ribosomal protein S20